MSKQFFEFDKTIAGFNFTAKGLKSYTKSINVGPLQLTFNVKPTGVTSSVSIPGTGISKSNIKII